MTATHTPVPMTRLSPMSLLNINSMSSHVNRQTVLPISAHIPEEKNVSVTSHVGKRREHRVPRDLCTERVHISPAVSNNTATFFFFERERAE